MASKIPVCLPRGTEALEVGKGLRVGVSVPVWFISSHRHLLTCSSRLSSARFQPFTPPFPSLLFLLWAISAS